MVNSKIFLKRKGARGGDGGVQIVEMHVFFAPLLLCLYSCNFFGFFCLLSVQCLVKWPSPEDRKNKNQVSALVRPPLDSAILFFCFLLCFILCNGR